MLYDDADTVQTSMLIHWSFLLLLTTFLATLLSSTFYLAGQWKKNPGKRGKSIAGVFILAVLLILTYSFGNENPLPIPGYKGHENIRFWLKLTDMWIYSVYALLALNFIALLGGILWSHFKNMK
jgi:hypothetical protein